LILWGVGDHGGGPSHQDLQDLEALIQETRHVEIRHSIPEAYFQSLKGDQLAIHTRDINPWGVGCYTSMSQVKQHHRMLENKYFMTEKMAAAAWCLKGFNYPVNLLKEALLDLATSEFHDILPGSSIQPVEEMALRLMDHGLELCSRIMAGSFFSLAKGQAPAKTDEIPILTPILSRPL
jgi:alpha-mannosidase